MANQDSSSSAKIPSIFTEQGEDSDTLALKECPRKPQPYSPKMPSPNRKEPELNSPKIPSIFTEQGEDSDTLALKECPREPQPYSPKMPSSSAEPAPLMNWPNRKEPELNSPKSSSTSGSGSASGSGSGSGSDSGPLSDSGSASSTWSVESTCSTVCRALQIIAQESICEGRSSAPAATLFDESDTMVLNQPISFLLGAFNSGWNSNVQVHSVLPDTVDDIATVCSVMNAAAYSTGRWFETYENAPKRLPHLVCLELFLAWMTAGRCIGRYLLSKHGYDKHMEMEDFGDFFTLGRF